MSTNTTYIVDQTLLQVKTVLVGILNQGMTGIIRKIQEIVRNVLFSSTEYILLTSGGPIYHQFGIPDIKQRLDIVIEKIAKAVRVEREYDINKLSQGSIINFTLEIVLIDVNYERLINSAIANFQTEKGEILEWLNWLLYEGTTPVIVSYHYLDEDRPQSRTNKGIMVPKGTWSVPEVIAGTVSDNWLTRAVQGLQQQLEDIVTTEFSKYGITV